MVHSDAGGFKPQNWMTAPTTVEEHGSPLERIVVRKAKTDDRLEIVDRRGAERRHARLGEAARSRRRASRESSRRRSRLPPRCWTGDCGSSAASGRPTSGRSTSSAATRMGGWVAVEVKRDRDHRSGRAADPLRRAPRRGAGRTRRGGHAGRAAVKPQARVLAEARGIRMRRSRPRRPPRRRGADRCRCSERAGPPAPPIAGRRGGGATGGDHAIDRRRTVSGGRRSDMAEEVLGSFHGSDEFPIEWAEGERELLWIFDDLHCPNPVSPMFFDIGGWWLTCDHMFRRFATPFASRLDHEEDQRLRLHGGDPGRSVAARRGDRVRGALRPTRAARSRVRGQHGCLSRLRPAALRAPTSSTGGANACGRRSSATSRTSTATTRRSATLVELAVLLEDAIDIHDRHWKIHWMLNFAQFSATMALNATIQEVKGEVDPESCRTGFRAPSTTATGIRSRRSGG